MAARADQAESRVAAFITCGPIKMRDVKADEAIDFFECDKWTAVPAYQLHETVICTAILSELRVACLTRIHSGLGLGEVACLRRTGGYGKS
jgi:hypothetical protein